MIGNTAFLRPAEVAPLLGVTSSRIYQLIAEGVIPATRVGGALRIPRVAWEEWLKLRAEEALAGPVSQAKRSRSTHARPRVTTAERNAPEG